MSSMSDLLHTRLQDKGLHAVEQRPTDHDLATLADWAAEEARSTPNYDWKRAYALIREGADLLLRRRAHSRCIADEVAGTSQCTAGNAEWTSPLTYDGATAMPPSRDPHHAS